MASRYKASVPRRHSNGVPVSPSFVDRRRGAPASVKETLRVVSDEGTLFAGSTTAGAAHVGLSCANAGEGSTNPGVYGSEKILDGCSSQTRSPAAGSATAPFSACLLFQDYVFINLILRDPDFSAAWRKPIPGSMSQVPSPPKFDKIVTRTLPKGIQIYWTSRTARRRGLQACDDMKTRAHTRGLTNVA